MEKMPDSFWTQSPDVLGGEPLQLIYAEVAARLQEENPGADTLEIMMIERVAFLYVYIRNKEATPTGDGEGFAHDRAYKETLQLWASMAAELRKTRTVGESTEKIKDAILGSVHRAMKHAITVLPKEQSKEFQAVFADRLEEARL